LPTIGVGDAIHQWTAPLNSYFYENVRAANALLIVSSASIDALGLFLLGGWPFVTYGVANDYFFSGHTAIAVFAATQLARFRRRWLTALALVIVLFEISTVLVLRAHYTMDVFTGIITALWVAIVCDRISPSVDRFVLGKN
jgi:membrane-associated phospholipid phosphatase